MEQHISRGGYLAERFRLPDLRVHASRSLQKGAITVTELVSDVSMPEPTTRAPYADAMMVGWQIGSSNHELWFDGRSVKSPPFFSGETCFYDLRRDPAVFVKGPYHSLQFYLPFAAINECALENGGRAVNDFQYEIGHAMRDPVIHHIGQAMIPAFRTSGAANSLILDHLLQAICAHVIQKYGNAALKQGPSGLARWQERRAKEMLSDCLQENLSLSIIARECGLSVNHFSRAFRATTGMPPHKWLMHQRVKRAKLLVLNGDMPLSEIAIECGFSDQSHFTRVFGQATGLSPAAWRREYKGPPGFQ
ncbi:MAG TPA: AraC family transcriptional regulator [Parvibaculum sp.]|jgi:AraC-like DNA-binding protein